jgi:proline dehydrogenase
MENSAFTDQTLDVLDTVWQIGYRNVGTVIQSYLKRSMKDVERLNALGVRIRLVKGAYREPREVAYQQKAEGGCRVRRIDAGAAAPGHVSGDCDARPAMIEATTSFAAQERIAKDAFEFQMLYGIRRDLQTSLSRRAIRFRVYVPFGREWFPYFMRRLGERPANVGFVLRSLVREK